MLSYIKIALGMLFLHGNRTVTKTVHNQPIIPSLPNNNIGFYLLKSLEASWNFYQISREVLVEKYAHAFLHAKIFFIAHTLQEMLNTVNYSSKLHIKCISIFNYLKDLLDLIGKYFCYVLVSHLSVSKDIKCLICTIFSPSVINNKGHIDRGGDSEVL